MNTNLESPRPSFPVEPPLPAPAAPELSAWAPLEACDPATRSRLTRLATPASFAPGQRLIEAGGMPERVVMASEGVLRVFHARGKDVQFTVKLLAAPDAVGLVEVVRGTPFAASVEALTPVSGVYLPSEALREALVRDPMFAQAVLADLAAKFEGTIHATRALGFDSCDARLARVLLEYAEHFGRPGASQTVVRYALSRQRLARETGSARRSVDRALQRFAAAGVLSLSPKGWLVVNDATRLRAEIGE